MFTRRSLLATGLALPASFALPFIGRAQSWPTDILRIIIPTAAGGPLDTIARLLAPHLRQKLGSTIIVENKTGAASSIGAGFVAKAPPDGGTWLFSADSFVVSQLVLPSQPYDVQKDFEPVTMVTRGAMVLCANPSRPYKTFQELIAAARAKPDTITCGTTGTGGMGHVTAAALTGRAGIKLVYVPFKGGAPAVTAAVGGHVDLVLSSAANRGTAGRGRSATRTGAVRGHAPALSSGRPNSH
jgi:tripartite-type tricarboxylate transporter receptor subunit TctC